MRTGKLRHLGSVSAPSGSTDAYGEITDTFTEIATPWIAIEPLTGTEGFEAEKLIGKRPVKLTLRYESALSAMDNGYRITANSKTYNIISVTNVNERNIKLDVLAIEVV